MLDYTYRRMAPLGPGFFERLEYDLEVQKWKEESGIASASDSSTSSSADTGTSKSEPLSVFRTVKTDVEEGFVTERRAGKYMERRVVTVRQEGGSLIRKLPHFEDFEGNVYRPYVRNSDIIPEDLLSDDEIRFSDSLYGDTVVPEGECPPGVRRFCCIEEELRLYADPMSIRFMKVNTSRMANPRQVKKTCENFKWLVRANEDRVRLFVTLTYAQNMRDTKRLYEDFRAFWQRLKRAYKAVTGYLVAFEPQRRGAWHAHVLLLSDTPLLYISNRHMHALWGHGFTKTQRPRGIRDVAVYLTSYLTDVRSGNVSKKGARLGMYPSGFRFARSSKKVRRTSVRRWFGPWNRLHRVQDWNLLYDYQNVRRLPNGVYNVSKILCLEDSSGVFFETPQ